ncbi:MAG: maleylacetoacetate isomerase, partial [Polyangiaceae bacterium]|nr:maleylacetoacetate isomerase [Polyangiaceae bacterium]
MKLYTYWRSSSAYRVRILLGLKELVFEPIAVDLRPNASAQRASEHRERNAMAQVPTLEWTTEDGRTRWLSQSMAIADYLESVHPEPPVFPRDPYQRARAIQLAEIINSGIQPLQNSGTLAHLSELGVPSEPWARRFISLGLDALEAEARREPYDFLVGGSPSVADAFLVPQLYNARRFGVAIERFERLLEVEARCAD